jgi:restriction system protein
MQPFLEYLEDGEIHSLHEIRDKVSDYFNLSEDDRNVLLLNSKVKCFNNRVGWAMTYLKKAKLIDIIKRGHYQITERGLNHLNENIPCTDDGLMRYSEFKRFKKPNKTKTDVDDTDDTELAVDQITPIENIENAYQQIHSELSDSLLTTIKEGSPYFFEKIVIDLLISMGYGGSRSDAGEAVGRTGDGGIDGVINEDRLGVDVIYIQAKRWNNTVPIKELRDFIGALASKKAKKGIFITTSKFPKNAKNFIDSVEYRIILIDGIKLANLMIEYDVGVSINNTYCIKSIDMDYFDE